MLWVVSQPDPVLRQAKEGGSPPAEEETPLEALSALVESDEQSAGAEGPEEGEATEQAPAGPEQGEQGKLDDTWDEFE